MPKIDRATLSKIAPDPQSVKAFEDLFLGNADNTAAIVVVTQLANDAQMTANAASLAADNAQDTADSAASSASLAQATADGAQATADAATITADAAAGQVAIIESVEGAHVVGIAQKGNVTSTNVRDAIYSLDENDGSGFRNVVLNGAFTVNQRKYVSGTATTSANQYTLDRWRVVVSGQSASFVAGANGNLVTVPAGGFEQVIEGALIVQTAYVISWIGNSACTVNGVPKINGENITLVPGANVTIRFSGGNLNSVQLEQGKTAHAFEPRPYSVELRLCQRYSFSWSSLGAMGVCASGAGAYAIIFPTRMRIPASYLALSNSTFSDGASTLSISGTTLNQIDEAGATVTFTAAGAIVGRAAILNSGSTAIFSAEF